VEWIGRPASITPQEIEGVERGFEEAYETFDCEFGYRIIQNMATDESALEADVLVSYQAARPFAYIYRVNI